MRPRSHDEFEIAIICALPLEFDAVEALFDEYYDEFIPAYGKQRGDANWYRIGRVAQHNIVLTCLPGMGIGSAASVASSLKVSFPRINLALLVGICGGVPFPSGQTEIILGDVVLSHRVVEYGFGRQYPDGFQQRGVVKETVGPSNRELRTFLTGLKTRRMHDQLQSNLLQSLQDLQHHSDSRWQYPGIAQDQLFEPSYRHRHYHLRPDTACLCMHCQSSTDPVCDKALENDCRKVGCMGRLIPRSRLHAGYPNPQAHFGSLASADIVMKSGEHRDRLAETEKVIGFEMEGAGISDNFPCVIIKGVCDYADSHKNKIWQDYASATAASCAKAFLQSWPATTQEGSSSAGELALATAALREFYVGAKRLGIQRISGERLPMDQCYINLAIVEHSHSAKVYTNQQSSPFSLFSRLKIETVDSGAQVSLENLFDPRKQSGDKVIRPKRILIQGRAGVGKTTLCKKIVYEYLYRGMWQDLFDWLLWVPLRQLKLKSSPSTYNMENLFYEEYFSQHPDGKNLARAMWMSINKSPARERTLFILDGLDEVSQEWGLGTPMNEFLGHLLRQPQVIITTRPQALKRNDLEPLDLELETIGFRPEQVKDYVYTVHEKPTADQIHAFIHSQWLIQGLVRIPIQLDALCCSWNYELQSAGGPRNMTTLYQAIKLQLWKKDICRLEKSYRGKLLTEAEVSTFRTTSQIEALVQDEISILECLAFSGLYNNIIDFNADYRDKITENVLPPERMPFSDNILGKLSFLRTSDSTLKDEEKSYHFLHLTFQEFLAAAYFIRRWISGQPLLCVGIDGDHTDIPPHRFLQKEKYNARYDIFWRFVAGLLHSRQNKKHLLQFFQMLDNEPQDLLGPAHQRLLMHCFREVPPTSDLEHLRTQMEVQLKQWALFECKLQGEMTLCREMEFPEHILSSMINEASEDVKKVILQALQHRSQFSSHLLDLVVSFLDRDVSTNLRQAAVDALSRQTALPENILQAIVSRIDNTDRDVRRAAAEALGRQTTLPENILQAIVSRRDNTDRDMRWAAVEALGKQSPLPESILQIIVSRFDNTDWRVREEAVSILGRQTTLPENILQAIVFQLDNTDRQVRKEAVNTLGRQTTLPENILQAIVSQLDDTDRQVREAAVGTLGRQTTLPKNILQALVSRIEDANSDIRWSTINALKVQSTLPDIILQAIVSRLDDTEPEVRSVTIYTLGQQDTLPENILQAIVSHLDDTNGFVRGAAVSALGKQAPLPDNILQAIVSQLDDTDRYVRQTAVNALGIQSTLPNNILQAIVSQLHDTDMFVRDAAIIALGKQTTLPDNILQAIVSQLDNINKEIRQTAINALGKQTNLPDNILQAIVSQLDDTYESVRLAAVYALGKQTKLPENILQDIVSQLGGTIIWDMKRATAIALSGQSTLPDNILQAFVSQLDDTNGFVRRAAVSALGEQTTLLDNILQDIVSVLCSGTSDIRFQALDVLFEHDNLHANVPNLDMTALRSLYEIMVHQSFSEQLSCYIQDGTFYINMPDRQREISLGLNKDNFLEAFQEKALALGSPISLQH